MGLGKQDNILELIELQVLKLSGGLRILSSAKKSLALQVTLANKTQEWDIVKTFAEVADFHKVLKKEYPDAPVLDLPHIPSHAKSWNKAEWWNYFKKILEDPIISEGGFLLTFISTQTKEDEEGMHIQFGEILKEGPLVYKKKSKKTVECWCVIRLRLFYFYRSRFDITPLGMIPLDDCTVDVNILKSPQEQPKNYQAVGMSVDEAAISPRHQKKTDTIILTPRGAQPYKFLPRSHEDRTSWMEAIEKVARSQITTHFRVLSTLYVQIEKAVNLQGKEGSGFINPYAIAHIENQQQKTSTIRKTLDPVWHETFHFHVTWYSAVLYLSVWNEDTAKSSDFLGKIAIPVAALPVDEEVDIWQALAPRDKHAVSGMVNLRIKYSFTIEEEEKSNDLKLFGAPLSPACPIPPIIKRAMIFLEENGLDVEGLFRLSANSIEMNEMRRSIDKGHDMDFSRDMNIHNISGLVKLWLRELPEPALTFAAYPRFLAALRENKGENLLPALKSCIESLPEAHQLLLSELLPFLLRVSQAQEKTKMTTTNLAVVFSPSMLRAKVESLDTLMGDAGDVTKVTSNLIDYARVLVGLDPLPS